ncbi:PA14 domain-containing protein [Marinobacter changyiensis]|uniref:PA14 domain-containing protein n=1 Tax=Marinobacter changyiensis TaxID=2604091 RepID=UPI00126532FB|nr:PA14 domain-containing protein [Marinobacter changyiensis]
MTKLLRTGLSLLLAGTCTFTQISDAAPQPGFLGEYFKGTSFNQPVTSRIDSDINFNWGSSSPIKWLPTDNFSVRWSGLFTAPPFSGTRQYRFTTKGDDGMRLFFKNLFVIDQWKPQSNKATKQQVV